MRETGKQRDRDNIRSGQAIYWSKLIKSLSNGDSRGRDVTKIVGGSHLSQIWEKKGVLCTQANAAARSL